MSELTRPDLIARWDTITAGKRRVRKPGPLTPRQVEIESATVLAHESYQHGYADGRDDALAAAASGREEAGT